MKTRPLVLLSDFGTKERFVATMKGVALSINPELRIFDLTHEIEPYDIHEAAYTLANTISFWPKDTVFVAVVDPGVGTGRHSVAVRTGSGHFVICPENGILSEVEKLFGIEEKRLIDEDKNRRPSSEDLHTFHGRDLYSYTGAKLAAKIIELKDIGDHYHSPLTKLNLLEAEQEDNVISGRITKVEEPYGNLVTNVLREMLEINQVEFGNRLNVELHNNSQLTFKKSLKYVKSFGFMQFGEPLVYPDSNHHVGLAVNGASFASLYDIHAGEAYEIKIIL